MVRSRTIKGSILVLFMVAVGLIVSNGVFVGRAGALAGGTSQTTGNYSVVQITDWDQRTATTTNIGKCSGTVVGNGWILTAAHCFYLPEGIGGPEAPVDNRTIEVTLNQGSASHTTIWSSPVTTSGSNASPRLDPNYNRTLGTDDLALIHVQNALPSWAVAIPLVNPLTSLSAGTGVTVFGWGETTNGVEKTPTSVQKSPDGSIRINTCPTGRSGWTCLIESGSTRILEGDSGGPVLVWADGAWQLAAGVDQNDPVNGVIHPDAYAWPVSPQQPATRSWVESLIGVPQLPSGQIIRDQSSGHSWLLEADGYRHSIPTGGDYLCFESQGSHVYNYPLLQVETLPEDVGSTATCTPTTSGGGGDGGGGGGSQSISIGWSTSHPTWISMTLNGFTPGGYTYTCDFASGGDESYRLTETSEPQTFDNGATCFDAISGDQVWVNIGSVVSNRLTVGGSNPSSPPSSTFSETTGGPANTWSNYTNAGGTEGPQIQSHQTVQISCKLTGFKVQDGNTWWYRIASNPWNNGYYVSADAFYNNGQTSGSLSGTPFVDPNVPNC